MKLLRKLRILFTNYRIYIRQLSRIRQLFAILVYFGVMTLYLRSAINAIKEVVAVYDTFETWYEQYGYIATVSILVLVDIFFLAFVLNIVTFTVKELMTKKPK